MSDEAGGLATGSTVVKVRKLVMAIPCSDPMTLNGTHTLIGPAGSLQSFFNPGVFDPPAWLCTGFHWCEIVVKQGLRSGGQFNRYIGKIKEVERESADLSI
jgi:hypothetical protein